MRKEKRRIKCIVHGLPKDLIPLVLAEAHYGRYTFGPLSNVKSSELVYWVTFESFKLRLDKYPDPHMDGWFDVEYVEVLLTHEQASALNKKWSAPDGSFYVWSSDPDYKDGMYSTEDMVKVLNDIGYEYYINSPEYIRCPMEFIVA